MSDLFIFTVFVGLLVSLTCCIRMLVLWTRKLGWV